VRTTDLRGQEGLPKRRKRDSVSASAIESAAHTSDGMDDDVAACLLRPGAGRKNAGEGFCWNSSRKARRSTWRADEDEAVTQLVRAHGPR
jgi:hypothetical protein